MPATRLSEAREPKSDQALAAAGDGRIEPPSHALRRGIVFERLRVLYVPVPKAGCTALLWALAGLSPLGGSHFTDSGGREVTRSLTIHDLSRWPKSFRFGERSPEERGRLLSADDWLRFTVVRHPFRRLWSAWQSKILLAEPQFIEKFSSEAWFPAPAMSAADILRSFRIFVDALERDPALVRSDVHWAPQVDLIDYSRIPYDHIGQVEKLGETYERLQAHVRDTAGAALPELPHTNVSALPYVDELFTEADVRFFTEMYAEDIRLFGYELPRDEPLGKAVPRSWTSTVDTMAPALEELRLRHERVADMYELMRARGQELREMKRLKQRQEKLRREEHRRNQRLQTRLKETTGKLQRVRNSRTWRYTAPLRKASARLRRLKRAFRGGR